jgi:thioredoxin 1
MVQIITELSQIPMTGTVVIDFFATWCGPCQRIAPSYEKLSDLFPGVQFFKVDVDESEEVVSQFDVEALPTFVILKDGLEKARVKGADLTSVIKALEMQASG